MPIYEYRCSRCEHEFEVWQKMSDPPIKVCPKCKAHKVEKLMSLSSFQLKGSGWYATDYGGKSGSSGGGKKRGSAKSESSSSESTSSSDSSKSSEKPADKASDKAETKASGGGGGTPRLAAAAA